MNTHAHKKRSGINPSVLPKTNNLKTMHRCVMTVTYLKGELSASSVVWLLVSFFFLMLINVFMQLCKNFF